MRLSSGTHAEIRLLCFHCSMSYTNETFFLFFFSPPFPSILCCPCRFNVLGCARVSQQRRTRSAKATVTLTSAAMNTWTCVSGLLHIQKSSYVLTAFANCPILVLSNFGGNHANVLQSPSSRFLAIAIYLIIISINSWKYLRNTRGAFTQERKNETNLSSVSI